MPRRSKRSFPRRRGEDRFPNGRLKPPAPNAKVVELRRAMLGAKPGQAVDISQAHGALDVAHARRWITEDQHRAAMAYQRLYRRAGVELPTLRVANLGEAEGEYAKEASRQGVFVDGLAIRPNSERTGDASAMARLARVWTALSPPQLRALNDACLVEGCWPAWILTLVHGLPLNRSESLRRQLLMAALDRVAEIELRYKRQPATSYIGEMRVTP